eukprot:Amastigsp_a677091_7.p5 type:complete len:107 gc:universal Amastigsp_a677091_7:860-1180(+)
MRPWRRAKRRPISARALRRLRPPTALRSRTKSSSAWSRRRARCARSSRSGQPSLRKPASLQRPPSSKPMPKPRPSSARPLQSCAKSNCGPRVCRPCSTRTPRGSGR